MWNVSLTADQRQNDGTQRRETERRAVLRSTTAAEVQQMKPTSTTHHWHHSTRVRDYIVLNELLQLTYKYGRQFIFAVA